MRHVAEMNRIVGRAASASLGKARVHNACTEPATDSEGNEALRVVVVEGGASRETSGECARDAIVRIASDLRKSGEDRFPTVEFATADEVASSDDTES